MANETTKLSKNIPHDDNDNYDDDYDDNDDGHDNNNNNSNSNHQQHHHISKSLSSFITRHCSNDIIPINSWKFQIKPMSALDLYDNDHMISSPKSSDDLKHQLWLQRRMNRSLDESLEKLCEQPSSSSLIRSPLSPPSKYNELIVKRTQSKLRGISMQSVRKEIEIHSKIIAQSSSTTTTSNLIQSSSSIISLAKLRQSISFLKANSSSLLKTNSSSSSTTSNSSNLSSSSLTLMKNKLSKHRFKSPRHQLNGSLVVINVAEELDDNQKK